MARKCKSFENDLTTYYYGELPPVERAELEAHLQICAHCRQELAALQETFSAIPQQPLLEPAETWLWALRKLVTARIRGRRQAQFTPNPGRFDSLFLRPVVQLGLAGAFVVLGFFLGRFSIFQTPPIENAPVLAVGQSQALEYMRRTINPLMTNVERVKFDPASGAIEIFFNSVQDGQLRGDLQDPAVQYFLHQALQDQENPAVRLHAVKAVGLIAQKSIELEPDLITTLTYLLQTEQNQGIRLQILRVLKSIPLDANVKTILTRILFHDQDLALRIEAFRALTRTPVRSEENVTWLKAVQEDSNSYLSRQATQLLQTLENPNLKKTTNTKPVKIMRKEKI